jgi:hypothetical protein
MGSSEVAMTKMIVLSVDDIRGEAARKLQTTALGRMQVKGSSN